MEDTKNFILNISFKSYVLTYYMLHIALTVRL